MDRLFILIMTLWLFSCQSTDKPDSADVSKVVDAASTSTPATNEQDKVAPMATSSKTISLDSTELKQFWTDCVVPIINLDKDKMQQFVYFPLNGDWGHMVNLKKPQQEWTEEDFYDSLQKLFYPEYIAKLKRQTYKDIGVYQQDNGEINLLVSVHFETIIDDFKAESSVILRFKKIDNMWKLYVIFAAG